MTSTIDSADALTSRESPSGGIQVRRATGSVGAIVTGVDLNDDFDEATGAIVREALHENCVLVVRGQFLTPDAHMRVARLWGEPYLPYYYQANSVEGYPHIAVVPNFGKERTPSEGWHVRRIALPGPAHSVCCRGADDSCRRRRHHVLEPVQRL